MNGKLNTATIKKNTVSIAPDVRRIHQLINPDKVFGTHIGFVNPVLLDGSDRIIAGHRRVLAAQALGMSDVPTVRAIT